MCGNYEGKKPAKEIIKEFVAGGNIGYKVVEEIDGKPTGPYINYTYKKQAKAENEKGFHVWVKRKHAKQEAEYYNEYHCDKYKILKVRLTRKLKVGSLRPGLSEEENVPVISGQYMTFIDWPYGKK